MKATRKSAALLVTGTIALAGALGAAGAALATPPAGIESAPILARGVFPERVDLSFKLRATHGRDVIHVKDAAQTVVQQIRLAAGGHTGWHSHHGPVVVVVQQGELTFVENENGTCVERTYSAGQAFVDPGGGHVHLARATGTATTELWATYFDVPPGASPRIDAADPGGCG
jgi:quercetin dioxygenase-like cupin family protein